MSPQNRPRTFGDLYTEIQEKSVLTPEQEDVLRDRAIERYGITGLRAKQQEILTTDTRRELSVLLSGLPEHDQILTKLDPLLPGGEIPKKVMLQEIQSKTPDPS